MQGIGVDLSLRGTGIARVEWGVHDRVLGVRSFFLLSAKDCTEWFLAQQIYLKIQDWIPEVDVIGIELPVARANASVLIRQAKLLGALEMLIPEVQFSKVREVWPTQTKSALGVRRSRKGGKKQDVIDAVVRKYGEKWIPDGTNRLTLEAYCDAIGVCHAARILRG